MDADLETENLDIGNYSTNRVGKLKKIKLGLALFTAALCLTSLIVLYFTFILNRETKFLIRRVCKAVIADC